MTGSSAEAAQSYEITYFDTGPEPEVRTVAAGEVAAVIEHTGQHGTQVPGRPCRRLVEEPGTRKEDAS
ncbi:hypothetical protein PL81_03945 [Streptomyces sp. RSD-27]|nr:hypothetical protein PL81_03945 [Streptomyces sp. RSD-27]